MNNRFLRTKSLIGEENFNKLNNSSVAVFGIGGVGGQAVEALARAGIGRIALVDADVVDISNINRQIVALHSTVGRPKVDVMEERIKDINPDAEVIKFHMFFEPDTEFDFTDYDYIIDAIDSMKSKVSLIERATRANVKIISALGAGNKVCPDAFTITDIGKTHTDPLARKLRKELKNLGIEHHKVVWSDEVPFGCATDENGRRVPSSISFVPPAAGLLLASDCIKTLIEE